MLSLAACAPKGPESPGAESADRPPEGAGPKTAFSDRCTSQASASGDGTLVSCDDGAFLFVIPGTDWTVDKAVQAPTVVSANSGKLNVSVRSADASETQYGVREHLDAVYHGAEKKLAASGGEITSAKFDETNGRTVVSYQLTTSIFDATLKTANAWTALKGKDGNYLDYHVSWAASADDPAWTADSSTKPIELVKNLANAFFVAN
jgi:hypothetical protein